MARRGQQNVIALEEITRGQLTELRLRYELPDLDAVLARANDMRPLFERVEALGWLRRAESYEGVRFGGIGTMPHGGPLRGKRERRDDDSVGYGPHLRRVSKTKRTLSAIFGRRFPPPFSGDVVDRVTAAGLRWIIAAELP
jgi:hypothetical protein